MEIDSEEFLRIFKNFGGAKRPAEAWLPLVDVLFSTHVKSGSLTFWRAPRLPNDPDFERVTKADFE